MLPIFVDFITTTSSFSLSHWYLLCTAAFAISCAILFVVSCICCVIEIWWQSVNEHMILHNQITWSRYISKCGQYVFFPPFANDSYSMTNVNFALTSIIFISIGSLAWPILVVTWLWYGSIFLGRFIRRTQKRVDHLTEYNK